MKDQKISLNHKMIFNQRFRKLGFSLSEYSFASLFLFQDTHQFELLEDYDLFVKGISYQGNTYLMPTSEHIFSDQERLSQLLINLDFIFPIPEEWVERFNPEFFSPSYRSLDSDYLFKLEKLEHYPGRKLSAKRNLMKQFEEQYLIKETPLVNDAQEAYQILEVWNAHKKETTSDEFACRQAIAYLKELDLFGWMVHANDRPAGFIIGEILKPNMAVIHFSKANVSYKGIYQYLFHTFASHLPDHHLCINMEQDLGLEGLRQSKRSYQPDKLLKKWRISLKK